jgi:hypothetical protein
MSFLERMREAADQLNVPPPDPWRKIIANAVHGMDAISTAALLDLVGARPTTSNARRLAAIMRGLNFIPIQSRRLMPGGFRDTVTRGWARPMRPGSQSEKVKL